MLSRAIWLHSADCQWEGRIGFKTQSSRLAFDASAVNPAEFSEVCRPDWGPGFGFLPFEKASKMVFVVVAVRSSCV